MVVRVHPLNDGEGSKPVGPEAFAAAFAPRMALNRITRRRRPARTGAVLLDRPFQ